MTSFLLHAILADPPVGGLAGKDLLSALIIIDIFSPTYFQDRPRPDLEQHNVGKYFIFKLFEPLKLSFQQMVMLVRI